MNEFQRKCMEVCDQVLVEFRISPEEFHEVKGKSEFYFLKQFTVEGRSYEIYLYEDEAGLMVGKEWLPCERYDFKSMEELARALANKLRAQLQKRK